jgi:hypothetical protein
MLVDVASASMSNGKMDITMLASLHSLSSLINLNSFWRWSLKLQFLLFDIASIDLKL